MAQAKLNAFCHGTPRPCSAYSGPLSSPPGAQVPQIHIPREDIQVHKLPYVPFPQGRAPNPALHFSLMMACSSLVLGGKRSKGEIGLS